MQYKYGDFSNKQIEVNAKVMHNEVHKLLLYKDKNVSEIIFNSDNDFQNYYNNLMYRFGGLNSLLDEPPMMVSLMSTLQAAKDEVESDSYNWNTYRRLILDAHGFIKSMFEEVV